MITTLIAIGIAVLLGARVLYLQKQVEALVAAKMLEGLTIQNVPAWQISGKTASRLIGLAFLIVGAGLGLFAWWINSPLEPSTLTVIKTIVAIIGVLAAVLCGMIACLGFFGGMD